VKYVKAAVVATALCLSGLGGCETARVSREDSWEQVPTWHFTLQHWAAAAGSARVYQVTSNRVTVAHQNDFGVEEPIPLYEFRLDDSQRQGLADALAGVRRANLQREYTDPKVIDGELLRFYFPLDGGPTRQRVVEVWNARPPELTPLIEWLNAVVAIHADLDPDGPPPRRPPTLGSKSQ
jgi:hypothetical protein